MKYVRIEDDIIHPSGETYPLTSRDNAQEARNSLENAIFSIPGQDAYLALLEIARPHKGTHSFQYYYNRAVERATLDSNIKAWVPEQVLSFFKSFTSIPENHLELNNLAIELIEDLKNGLENGDTSNAELLKIAPEETLIRNYLANHFRIIAQKRYAVAQEEEMADAKRPDIRIHGTTFDAPLPIELKIADRWSGPKLQERLISQLCGDYLRDECSTYGIFLLFNQEREKQWRLPSSGSVGFEDLIHSLQKYWEHEQANYPHVAGIKVIGIDLTKRKK